MQTAMKFSKIGIPAGALMLGIGLAGSSLATGTVSGELAGNPSPERVTQLLGSTPLRCTNGLQRRVCTWRVAQEAAAHEELNSKNPGAGAVQVVCDFATRGVQPETPTESASRCSVHLPRPPKNRNRRGPPKLPAPADATSQIDRARTLTTLSHAIGGGPDDCVQRDTEEWICGWSAHPRDPAHSMLSRLADTTGPARLVCRLPLEGGDRGLDSCRALEIE